VKTIGVTETMHFRWRAEYGGMKSDQVMRLKLKQSRSSKCPDRVMTPRA